MIVIQVALKKLSFNYLLNGELKMTSRAFTRREDYPGKGVNPSWRAKDSPGLQAKFHR